MNEEFLKLDGKKFKQLREALQQAFPDENKLKSLLREELDVRLNEIVENKNLTETVSDVMYWAEEKGRLGELVSVAIRRNPGNPKLRNFIRQLAIDAASKTPDYLDRYISKFIAFDTEFLSEELLIELFNVIQKIDNFPWIWEIGKSLMPSNITIDRYQEIQDIKQPDLSNQLKYFTLLKLLLQDYPVKEQHPSILILVGLILKEKQLDRSIEQQLKEWLHKASPNFNYQQQESEKLSSPAANQFTARELQAYLMIAVNLEKKNQVRAIASLLCISPTGTRKEIPVHLNPASNERGVLCTPKKLPNIVKQFIQKSISNVLETPENLLGCVCYDLTVELFLPIAYLCEPVDRWEIEDDFNNSVRLGCQHRLVLRSYDRAVKPSLKNEFSRSWHEAKDFLEKQPDVRLIHSKIQHLDNIDCARLMQLKKELKQKIGLKAICALPESDKEKESFFQAILMSGIPIAFWTLCRELPPCEVDAGIQQFLTPQLLLNPCELLEQVRTERESAFCCKTPEKHWGSHLSVLWDNWERMPTLEPLKSS